MRGRGLSQGCDALLFDCFTLGAIWRLPVNIADELRQACVPELLADGEVLADMIPVVIDSALQHVPVDAGDGLALDDRMRLQCGGRQRVEPRVGCGRDRLPCREHLLERRRAGWRAVGKFLLDLREEDSSLPEAEEVTLFLPRQMTDVPTDAIHRQEAFAGVVITDAFDRAHEFTAGKAELGDERVGHGWRFLSRSVVTGV